MQDSFKSILVPVDLGVNTEAALSQAKEMASKTGSTIHLLHVRKPKNIWRSAVATPKQRSIMMRNGFGKNVFTKLFAWKKLIEEENPNNKVHMHLSKGIVQKKIEEAAKLMQPQLIIVVKRGASKVFSCFDSVCPNELAESTGVPVLTVSRHTPDDKLKVIVVPVSSFIPKRKIEFVVEFAKKYRAEIHLVTISNRYQMEDPKQNAFLETYKILKTGLTNPIEYHVLKGNNFPKAILHYAECIQADMILVNPRSETIISRFSGKHINEMLPSGSKLKILSIMPYLNKSIT